MRGDLSRTSAADICRDLASRSVTGTLVVDGPDGPGTATFVDGRLVAVRSPRPTGRLLDRLVATDVLDPAEVPAPNESPGEATIVSLVEQGLLDEATVRAEREEQLLDELLELASWRYGTFRFTDEVPPTSQRASLDVSDALERLEHRQRGWEAVRKVLPDLDAVPERAGTHPPAAGGHTPALTRLLAAVDGHRSVSDLAAGFGYGEVQTARMVHELVEAQELTVRLPSDEVGSALEAALAPPPADPAPAATEPSPPTPEMSDTPSVTDAAEVADPHPSDPPATEPEPTPSTTEPVPAALTTEPGATTPAAGTSATDDETDVSEFLRELSRLAGQEEDDADPPPANSRTRQRQRSQQAQPRAGGNRANQDPAPDDRPRRRGLFGRG